MILEYMLEKGIDGVYTPPWVEDGGYWYNPDDHTFIGWSPNLGMRDYYIPETVYILSRQQIIDRVLAIHQNYPILNPSPDSVQFTEEEIIDQINNWCDERGET